MNEQKLMQNNRSSMKDFEVISQLGKGSFGTVYKVRRKMNNSYYVMKQINIKNMSRKHRAEAINEVTILSKLDSQYIVKYLDSFIESNYLNIIMEYCEGGDLYTYIKQQNGKMMREEKIWNFFIQMCMGLDFIHKQKILHRDIKTMNIFLTKDGSIRIGDLGVAKVLNDSANFANTMVGTPFYLSPEMCEERPYNEKSDVWALGCVLYELCTFKPPFDAKNQAALILKIIRGNYNPIPSSFSKQLEEMVNSLLCRNYQQRPNTQIILNKQIIIEKALQLKINLQHKIDSNNDVAAYNEQIKVQQHKEIENKIAQDLKLEKEKKLKKDQEQKLIAQELKKEKEQQELENKLKKEQDLKDIKIKREMEQKLRAQEILRKEDEKIKQKEVEKQKQQELEKAKQQEIENEKQKQQEKLKQKIVSHPSQNLIRFDPSPQISNDKVLGNLINQFISIILIIWLFNYSKTIT